MAQMLLGKLFGSMIGGAAGGEAAQPTVGAMDSSGNVASATPTKSPTPNTTKTASQGSFQPLFTFEDFLNYSGISPIFKYVYGMQQGGSQQGEKRDNAANQPNQQNDIGNLIASLLGAYKKGF